MIKLIDILSEESKKNLEAIRIKLILIEKDAMIKEKEKNKKFNDKSI